MYNREIKEQFLTDFLKNKNEKSYLAKLEALSLHEEFLCKDLCQMSLDEVIEATKLVKIGTYKTAFALVSFIRSYTRWCLKDKVLPNINNKLLTISIDDIDISDSLKGIIFNDEDEFVKELRSVRTFDDGYYDVIALIFSWIGLSIDDMLSIKITSVNFENQTVSFGGKVCDIPEIFTEILGQYAKTKRAVRQNYNCLREVYRDDSFDTFIRKFCAPKQLGKRLTKSQLWDSIHALNETYMNNGNMSRFTLSNAAQSGLLNRLYKLESSGIDVFSAKNKEIVLDAFVVDIKLHEGLWLYKNYKRALNL